MAIGVGDGGGAKAVLLLTPDKTSDDMVQGRGHQQWLTLCSHYVNRSQKIFNT